MKRIKLGIIGTGQIVNDAYLPIMPFLENVEETQLYDINYESARCAVESFKNWLQGGIFEKDYAHHFPNANKRACNFLKKLEITKTKKEILDSSDVILITTPPKSHIPIAVECLSYNKTIILEKPLSSNLEEIERLPSQTKKSLKDKVRYIENFVFNPAYVKLRNKINSGQIGDVILVETCLANTGPSQYKDQSIWRILKEEGGGALLDWGPHTIALSLYLAGLEKELEAVKTHYIKFSNPRELIAGQEVNTPIDLESLISLLLTSQKKITTNILIENSWRNNPDMNSPNGRSWVKVEGTLGSYLIELIKCRDYKEYHLTYNPRRGLSEIEIIPIQFPHDSFYYGLKTILESDKSSLPEYCTFDFGLKILKIIDEAMGQRK